MLELMNRQAESLPQHQQLIVDLTKALVNKAREDLEAGRVDQARLNSDLLYSSESRNLISTAFNQDQNVLKSYIDNVSNLQGTIYRRIADSQESSRDAADLIHTLMESDDFPKDLEEYVRLQEDLARHSLAAAQYSLSVNNPINAKAWYELAQETYREVAANTSDPQRRQFAEERVAIIQRDYLVPMLQERQEERTPTPTPEPDFFEKYLPQGIGKQVSDFFTQSDLLAPILQWVIIAAIVLVVIWGVPNFILYYIATHYDVNAATYKMSARKYGIFSLISYLLFYMKNRKKITETKAKSGCPSCGFNLEDYFAYDDLMFSKCPKCKADVTPVITLEGFVDYLAQMLSTDVERINSGVESVEKIVRRDAMVQLVRAVVTLGVRRRASDLHVEPDEDALVIRQRIDGMMTEMFHLPRSLALAVVSAIKVQAGLNIAERRIPQDGKVSMLIDGTNIDVRVATSPASAGETCTMRLLDIRSIQLEAKHLGMSPENQETFHRTIHGPHGLMLVAGPTGSGKTTTLYVALQQIRPTNRNIISIEDPIEFRIPGANQIQINTAQGLTFASALRSVLRQDPDVIMVGEIRDKETAEISVNSATTGHLVLSTLHTIDASASIARLIDLGVSPRQFADALALIAAQRLIRLVCSYCAQPIQPSMDMVKGLGLEPDELTEFEFKRGSGCNVCNNTGYFRRSGIFEFLTPSHRLRVAMESGSITTQEIREIAIAGGMRTLRQEALDLLKQGLTTVDEMMRVTK